MFSETFELFAKYEEHRLTNDHAYNKLKVFDLVATKAEIEKLLQNNATDLAQWVKNAKSTGRFVKTIWHGKIHLKATYMIPRNKLLLNFRNHRFTTEWDNLKQEQIKKQKDPEFNPFNDDDVETIRAVIRGSDPWNKTRSDSFEELVEGMEKAAGEVTDSNGQEQPGIVLENGTYVNGNRRDTALEWLTNGKEVRKKGKKYGATTNKFDLMEVGICNKDTTESDIRLMEIREQISMDLRDEYDFMNAAMLTKEQFTSEKNRKIRPSMSGKKKQLIEETIINEIAAQGYSGKKSVSRTKEYLDFMMFVDQVLKAMGKENQYYIVNQSSGDDKPFSFKLKGSVKYWKEKRTMKEKIDYAEIQAATVYVHQKGSKDFPRGAKGYRSIDYAINNPKTVQTIIEAKKQMNLKNPTQAQIQKAEKYIINAVKTDEIQRAGQAPFEELEDVVRMLSHVVESLTKGGELEKKMQILSQKRRILDEIDDKMNDIEDAIKKFDGSKKKRKK